MGRVTNEMTTLAGLRQALLAADYGLEAVTERLGESALAGLQRNTSMAAVDALGSSEDPQATLISLFALQRTVPALQARAALGNLAALQQAELIDTDGDQVRAAVEIRPYGFADAEGDWEGWIVHDLNTTLDSRGTEPRPDFVLGASPASTTLAQLTVPTPVGRALDLGTGCGIQVLHLARHAASITATDLNPRALKLARATLALNELDADLRLGSLYEPVTDDRFDLIVTNPPFVMSPPTGERLVYREGSFAADGLMREVVAKAAAHLTRTGVLQVVGNWAVIKDEDPARRLSSWLGTMDALVIERERLDPYEYIEVWLADAGQLHAPGSTERYRAWLDYFAAHRIEAVALGWINAFAGGQGRRDYLSWPHAVAQPVGPAMATYPQALDASQLSDVRFLAQRWQRPEGVVQETIGEPGAADPQHIVLRQQFGLARAVTADTALAAVVGACDGELRLGDLLDAVAGLLEVPAEALIADLLPRLRTLVEQGFLVPDEPLALGVGRWA